MNRLETYQGIFYRSQLYDLLCSGSTESWMTAFLTQGGDSWIHERCPHLHEWVSGLTLLSNFKEWQYFGVWVLWSQSGLDGSLFKGVPQELLCC